MRWYDHLYVGDKAKRKRYRIIQNIRRGKLQAGAYVITQAENGNNLLDIYPSRMLLLPYYRDLDLFVLGIAADYWESLKVAGRIVDDLYQKTGGFNLSSYLADRDGGKV